MITNYNDNACKYAYSKLKDVIYLVSATHTKKIHIDGGDAYIEDLYASPLRLEGFNIHLTEESSLNEMYTFNKSVTISMRGYVSNYAFQDKYYVILEDEEGVKWMVNPDFPLRLTYTYNLNDTANETDFTLQARTNYPTLRCVTDFVSTPFECKNMVLNGIDDIKLIEKDYAVLDVANKVVNTYSSVAFKDVKPIKNSASLQEVFDGERIETNISFNIYLNDYKASWHYDLLEFDENKYSAVVSSKTNNKFYCGFEFGMQPNYRIQASSNDGENDIITITLSETSLNGIVAANDIEDQAISSTTWVNVKMVGDIVGYECYGNGKARYLLKQEIDSIGNVLGNYKCLEGYESLYTSLNIVGTFSSWDEFYDGSCVSSCGMVTTIPNNIEFSGETC